MKRYKSKLQESKNFSVYDDKGNIKIQGIVKGNNMDIRIESNKTEFDMNKFKRLLMKAIKGSEI